MRNKKGNPLTHFFLHMGVYLICLIFLMQSAGLFEAAGMILRTAIRSFLPMQ